MLHKLPSYYVRLTVYYVLFTIF